MTFKLFKGKTEAQCGYCEYAEIAPDRSVAVCRKMGGVMQLHSKCRKFRYDPLKREPKTPSFSVEFSKDDFQL